MNAQDISDRFDELEAGRILGELAPDEIKEWHQLSADPSCQKDLSLELTAAALEVESCGVQDTALPDELLEKIRGTMSEYILAEPEKKAVIYPARWQQLLTTPKAGWAIAALFAVLLVAKVLVGNPPADPESTVATAADKPSFNESRDALISKANDLLKSDFSGVEKFTQMSGTVIWSDEAQEGYMSLTDLPVNDPSANQYQLWIVDPKRDEEPVNGGVFDIAVTDGTAVIPIRNPLAVTNPQAFVITLEQPGGVVVSDQDVVVALAKTS
jgi:hypothetical protein